MTDVMLYEIKSDSRDRRYVNQKRFLSKDQKSKKNTVETRPLLFDDYHSSGSDDEITLHDVSQLNKFQGNDEVSQLRQVNKAHANGRVSRYGNDSDPFRHYELLDHKVEKDDTLQSISIKYHCSKSDLKRANKLINDQEFYALKYVKIPVKKYSLFTEVLPPVHASRRNSTTVEDSENNVQVINIGIGGRCPSPQDTAAFFKRMDEDLVKIMLNTQSQKDSFEEASAGLTTSRIEPLIKDSCTEDYVIQWNYVIICAIVLAVVVPTVVALYLYFKSSHSQPFYYAPDNDSFSTVAKSSVEIES